MSAVASSTMTSAQAPSEDGQVSSYRIGSHNICEAITSQQQRAQEQDPMVTLPISPIMHGGAQWGLLMHLFAGHATTLVPTFDPDEIWQIVDEHGVQVLFFDGDAMARPLIEAYEKGSYDRSSLAAERGHRISGRRAKAATSACR